MQKSLKPKPIFFMIIIAIVLIVISLSYSFLIGPVNVFDNKEVEIEIPSGTVNLNELIDRLRLALQYYKASMPTEDFEW